MSLLEILVIIACVLIVGLVSVFYIIRLKNGKTCCDGCEGCAFNCSCKKKKDSKNTSQLNGDTINEEDVNK